MLQVETGFITIERTIKKIKGEYALASSAVISFSVFQCQPVF